MGISDSNKIRSGWLRNFISRRKNMFCNRELNLTGKYDSSSQGIKKDAKVQTNYIDTESNINAIHGKTKGTQNSERCQGRILAKEQRGCGFHFYFCIDNIRKSDLVKNKQIRQIKNEANKYENNFKHAIHDLPSQMSSNTSNVASSRDINTTENKKLSQGIPGAKLMPQTSIEDVDNEKQLGRKPETAERHSILRCKKGKSNSSLAQMSDTTQASSKIRFYPSKEKLSDTCEKEVEVKLSKRVKPREENKIFGKIESQDELETPKTSTVEKNSMKNRGTFVRNSLISLRKRKTSEYATNMDDIMISQILLKLNHIEDKIAELEKVGGERGKDIKNIVGISCNKRISKLSETLGDKEVKNRNNSSVVSIKVCGDGVFIDKDNGEKISSTLTKTKSNKRCEQLVYHNTLELDAHTIASEPHNQLKTNKSRCENTNKVLKAYSMTTPLQNKRQLICGEEYLRN